MKRPTLRQIGQKAGVSHVTVSLALRNHPSIPSETCKRLQKLAASLGYQPKPLVAAAMAQMREGFPVARRATLALLVFMYDSVAVLQPFAQWIRGVRQRADQLGYGLDCFNLYDQPTTPEAVAKILHSRNILGVVILNPVGGVWRLELDPVLASYPVAVVGRYPSDMPAYHASQNDLFGTGLLLFGECYKAGCRRIGIAIEGGLDYLTKQRLEMAFIAARESHPENFPIPVFINWTERKHFSAWLEQHRPDCLIITDVVIKTWIDRYHAAQARTIGIVHWNLYSEIGDWSGTDQKNIEVGMSAVDLVVGQIHRGERGLPTYAKRVLLTSTWRDGTTMKRAPQATEHHKSWLRTYPGTRPVSRRRWRTIDLRKHVNRNPESPGEWFGTLPLLHWGSGEKTIHGVPFDLIDPRKNQGRSVILYGPKEAAPYDPGSVEQEETTGISLGFSAGELYFLHACGFVTQPGIFAHYHVIFDSGKRLSIPLVAYLTEFRIQSLKHPLSAKGRAMWRRRANIQDWWPDGPPHSFNSAYPLEVTADGDSVEYVRYLYTLRWRNPRPYDVIRSLQIVQHAGTTNRLAVMGITALLTGDR